MRHQYQHVQKNFLRLAPPIILMICCILSCAFLDNVLKKKEVYSFIGEDVELIRGQHLSTGWQWTAIRIDMAVSKFRLILPFTDGRSHHLSELDKNPSFIAVLNGSPHLPLRVRSKRPQNISGFHRINGYTYSLPDRLHDALGIDADGRPHILRPTEQENWQEDAIGGFYAILIDSIPQERVTTRDALAAVGWNVDGEFILLVADGRKGKGISYPEAGQLLLELGAVNGMTLDGGGSARLRWKSGDSFINFPAKRLFYRAVPNVIAVLRQ